MVVVYMLRPARAEAVRARPAPVVVRVVPVGADTGPRPVAVPAVILAMVALQAILSTMAVQLRVQRDRVAAVAAVVRSAQSEEAVVVV